MNETLLQKELKQTTPFRSALQEAALAILRTSDVVRQRLAGIIEPHGITAQQYNVLRILRGSHPDPLPTLEIASRMIERTPGVTRLIDRLEAKKLARRERCPQDRRIVHCWITEKGLELLASMDREMDRAEAEALGSLSKQEARALTGLLDKVRQLPTA